MNDWPFNPEAMPDVLPPSRAIDVGNIETEASAIAPRGTAVLLLSGSEDEEWAARAAVEICVAWAATGRRVVLADLHIEKPLLASDGDPGMEGIVDVLLYGASLSRIATPGRGGAYYLIPAGTYAIDSTEIFRHPRWRKLSAGFRDTGATLLLFAPTENVDLEGLSAWTSEAILFGSAGVPEVAQRLATDGVQVLAVLVKESPEVRTPALVGSNGGAALPAEPPPLPRTPIPETSSALRDRPSDPDPEGSTFLIVALLVLTVLLVVAIWVVYGGGNDSPPASSATNSAQVALPGVAPLIGSELASLAYSVNVKAFTSLTAARQQVAIEQARIPSTVFFISPEEIQGVVYYKILAGLAPDTLSVGPLRDELIRLGAIEEADVAGIWTLIEAAPLAYDLGRFATRDEALARADSLLDLGVPAYPAAVPGVDGTPTWRLYGGAFRDASNADWLGRTLLAAGIASEIVPRSGLPATIAE